MSMLENLVVYENRLGNIEAVEGTLPEKSHIKRVIAPKMETPKGGGDEYLRPCTLEVACGRERRRIKIKASSLEEAEAHYADQLAQFEAKKRDVSGELVTVVPWTNGNMDGIQSSWTFALTGIADESEYEKADIGG